jgi:hypothetical protein
VAFLAYGALNSGQAPKSAYPFFALLDAGSAAPSIA